jgi:hypothetical protein
MRQDAIQLMCNAAKPVDSEFTALSLIACPASRRNIWPASPARKRKPGSGAASSPYRHFYADRSSVVGEGDRAAAQGDYS